VWPKIVVKRTNGSHEVQPKATQMRSASSESWTSEHLGLPHPDGPSIASHLFIITYLVSFYLFMNYFTSPPSHHTTPHGEPRTALYYPSFCAVLPHATFRPVFVSFLLSPFARFYLLGARRRSVSLFSQI